MKRSAVIAVLAVCGWLPACHMSATNVVAAPGTVTVERPKTLQFRDYLEVTGNTAASRSVNLTARVEGYLQKIYFRDGSFVEAGAPLFLIQPDEYQAKVQLNQAQLVSAQAEYERQKRLMAEHATSKSSVENWLSQRDAAEANTRLAQINLDYTRVSAPFAGRIGRHLVDEGNLVGNGGATVLATLEQIRPIYAYFTVNERDVLRLRKAMAARNMTHLPEVVPVEAALQTDNDFAYHGVLNFVDTSINASTGTLQARASFPNDDLKLLPGLFVNVRIALGSGARQLAVPDTAVARDQAGPYVLLVDSESQVVQRRVQTGGLVDGMRAITHGLSADDRVVVDGLLNATPGNKVQVRQSPGAR